MQSGGRSDVRLVPQDIFETAQERSTARPLCHFLVSGGSIPGADRSFEEEVQVYIETLQAIGANFSTRRFPSQLMASPSRERN